MQEVSTLRRSIFRSARAFGLQNQSALFIQNLSVLVSAGLTIPAALSSVLEETRDGRMASAIREIQDSVDEGKPFSTALREAGIASTYTEALISIGEESGRLSENLQIAAEQNEKETEFRSRIRSALLYSSFVLMVALVIGVGISWYVLPQIASFFVAFHVPLPFVTRVIIGVGLFLKTYGYVVVPLFFCIILGLSYFLFSFPKTRFIGHMILFHIPLFKNLIRDTEISRFGFITGTMMRAGVPLPKVFDILPTTTTFQNYRNLYVFIGERLQEGYSFQRAFQEYPGLKKVMPSAVRQMIVAAERSGALSDTLIQIGGIYERRVDAASRNIPAFLEPALLLVIGLFVAILALGILMPIYRIGLSF
jgi:type II secretory pathway component PulF